MPCVGKPAIFLTLFTSFALNLYKKNVDFLKLYQAVSMKDLQSEWLQFFICRVNDLHIGAKRQVFNFVTIIFIFLFDRVTRAESLHTISEYLKLFSIRRSQYTRTAWGFGALGRVMNVMMYLRQ